ncbi:MAG TPA: hypothetical protein VK859_13545, partial [bacterium]|nr:hypothetical protein [bacterium]
MRPLRSALAAVLFSSLPVLSIAENALKNPATDPCVLCVGKWKNKNYEKCLRLLEKQARLRSGKKGQKNWVPPALFMDSSFEDLEKMIRGGNAQAVSLGFR